MKRSLRKMAVLFTSSFLLMSFGLVYWQVLKAGDLMEHPSNRRGALMEERIIRGSIYDRSGLLLAATQVDEEGRKVRTYHGGAAFQPLLGYTTQKYGSAGLEAKYAETLLGLDHVSLARQAQNLLNEEKHGNDLVLTLDAKLQKIAYEGLRGKIGSVVALDPRTGQVLAMVSQPSYDAADLEESWESVNAMAGSPFMNHALALYSPGSTMKIMTSAALFGANLEIADLYHCTGSTVINGQLITEQNEKAHGWVNYDLAMAYSCNAYFAENAVQAGSKTFLAAMASFGFGQVIPFDFYVQPSSITREEDLPTQLDINLFAASSFGQGQVLTSPLQMALVTAGVANEGKMMKPYLLAKILDEDGNVVHETQPEVWLEPFSREDAAKVKSGMILAVNEGTAKGGLWSESVQVCAKTGSAETGNQKEAHAWYVAFAPAENPRIAVAVLVEHGGTGNGAAAPIAKNVMQAALERWEVANLE